MLYVKVKDKQFRFTLLIPYPMVTFAISVLPAKFFDRHVSKRAQVYGKSKELDFTMPPIDKEILKTLVKELKNHKGTVLIDVKTKDGTEVKVRL